MRTEERKDLYKLLTSLADKLWYLSDETADIDTASELQKLGDLADESACQLMARGGQS